MDVSQQSGAAPQPALLRLLADETRWRLVGELRWSDRQVGELCARLELPQNLVSYHLGLLRDAGLVQSRRSDADGRALFYGLELGALQQALHGVAASLHLAAPAEVGPAPGTVLFVCTHNSARSQMAEGWLRHLSGGRIVARSAGTSPAAVHPLATQVMAEVGVDIGYQRAKALDAVGGLAPAAIVTVCDLAREECATALDAPIRLHWSVPDPAGVADAAARLAAFRAARDALRTRVVGLLGLLGSSSINLG